MPLRAARGQVFDLTALRAGRADKAPSMAHTLLVNTKLPREITRTEVSKRMRILLRELGHARSSMSVVLTSDTEIRALNKNYRGYDEPTDVLAFALREGEFSEMAGRELGDVIVSVETAERQAREAGKTLMDELTMLLAHGTLHLLGWDHDTKKKDAAMRARTDELCAKCVSIEKSVSAHKPVVGIKVKPKTAKRV